ncbi:MAG TPA: hypothetical protein VGX50_14830 [Longimicrobium sp.]|jgi:hypothetical protein|nr:hypothetical protein [Longimicrobium sp.]
MATREPPVELFYDPAELDPDAPRLYVRRNGTSWRLLDQDGVLLSAHASQDEAIDAARRLSGQRFSEILVRGSTDDLEWRLDQDPEIEAILGRLRGRRAPRRHFDVKNLRLHTGLRLIRTCKWLVPGRNPPVELFYDPADLDPDAPRLRIGKGDGRWQLRDDDGALLSCHTTLPDALDAAAERSNVRFSEILVREATGRQEWSYHHNPDWMELIRLLVHTAPLQREGVD